jgi:hypothetical protein
MLRFFSKTLRPIIIPVICGLLSGCMANAAFPGFGTAADADLSPAQRQMRKQTAALNKTVWEGAAMGALAGALAGALIDRKQPLRGGLLGAFGGGLAGGAAGQYVAARQQEAGNTLNTVEAITADVRRKNVEARQAIDSMETVIAEDRRKVAILKAQLRDGQITQAKYEQQAAVVRDDHAEIAGAAKCVADQSQVFEESAATLKARNPYVETGRLNSEIDSLKALNRRMGDLEAVSRELAA